MKTLSHKAFTLSGIVLGTAFLFASCSGSMEEKSKTGHAEKMADSVSGLITSSAPAILTQDSAHAFIRKADIRFMVKDVKQSTYKIEDIVKAHHGYVTYTNLQSNIQSRTSIRLSADTMADITNYEMENSLTIRVPNDELDGALKEIGALVDFLDHRKITADDVKFQMLANKLSEARFRKHQKRFEAAIDEQGKKLSQTTEAENELIAKQQSADETRIETMSLLDEVHFSTVSLLVYQPETQKASRYDYIAPQRPYEPDFGSRLLGSLADGGKILGEVFLFLVRLWPLAIIALAVLGLIRFISRQKWLGMKQ